MVAALFGHTMRGLHKSYAQAMRGKNFPTAQAMRKLEFYTENPLHKKCRSGSPSLGPPPELETMPNTCKKQEIGGFVIKKT